MPQVLPKAQYFKRQGYPLKKITQYATNRGYTDVMVLHEDRKQINGMLLIHLPGGPTAQFRLSNMVLCKDIKVCAPSELMHLQMVPGAHSRVKVLCCKTVQQLC